MSVLCSYLNVLLLCLLISRAWWNDKDGGPERERAGPKKRGGWWTTNNREGLPWQHLLKGHEHGSDIISPQRCVLKYANGDVRWIQTGQEFEILKYDPNTCGLSFTACLLELCRNNKTSPQSKVSFGTIDIECQSVVRSTALRLSRLSNAATCWQVKQHWATHCKMQTHLVSGRAPVPPGLFQTAHNDPLVQVVIGPTPLLCSLNGCWCIKNVSGLAPNFSRHGDDSIMLGLLIFSHFVNT